MHNYKLGYLSIGALVFLDLFSKYFVQKYLDIGTSIELIPILDLVLAYNSGIAFSLFDYNNFFTTYGLLIIGIILIVYLHYIYRKDPLSQQNFSIAMILAGAIGNILDRFHDGVVTDFLYFHIGNTSFFIFNIADAYISIGAVIFFLLELIKIFKKTSL